MLINGRFLTQRLTGVQRFAREILRSASKEAIVGCGNAELLVPQMGETLSSFENIPVRHIGRQKGHVWEQTELSSAAPERLLINLCNTAPILRQQQLVVLHDATIAAFPQNFTLMFRAWYQLMIRTYGRRAQSIATVSAFSADEITRYFGIPRHRIDIIPESGEHILRMPPDYSLHEKFSLEPDGYFLAVSSLASNKNFSGLLKAVARLPSLPFKFVIAGGRQAKVFHHVNVAEANAIETGYATDAQLRALYECAASFVYPSIYEGFGIPPLEAMTCGCPVLVSRAASLPEICGTGAAYCDPHDPDDIARQLYLLLSSKSARDELRAAGLARARQWTWAKAACRLDEVISNSIN
jgi:glycosyltransferase involved in cell wall biosynthesis